jgi:uncharacterized membrane protein YedE/YeeE
MVVVVFRSRNCEYHVYSFVFWEILWFFIQLENALYHRWGGKKVKFFDFNWRTQIWNLVFLVGAILGGFLAKEFLSTNEPLKLAESTVKDLKELGFEKPTTTQPLELFSLENAFTLKGFLVLAIGGLLVGFGSRYAGGCTSGHAISGLSDLQVPSLIAVIGFFIGGLAMTFLIFPLIFK